MRSFRWLAIIFCFVITNNVIAEQSGKAYEYDYLSPQAMADDQNGLLYIAQSTARCVTMFDTKTDEVKNNIYLEISPGGLALSKDGKVLYVTELAADGRMMAIEIETGEVLWQVRLNHTPVSPTISADGKVMYVCNRFSNNISVIDLETKKVVKTIAVVREPVDSVLTNDGRWLFVINQMPDGSSDREHIAANISIIDTKKNELVNSIEMLNGVTDLKDICLSPDGQWGYVTHILARYQVPTTQLERGWQNTNAVSIIDIENQQLYNTVLLDDIDLGCANPFSVGCTGDGKFLCVTSSGTHEITVIDRIAMHKKLDQAKENVPYDLSFLAGIKKRHKLKGNGPRHLEIIGNNAYASEYFSGSLAKVEISLNDSVVQSFTLGKEKPVTIQRRGEMFFNDAALCFQQWQSCASCHPDARTHGLNWDLLNDGIGNPKSTKSMLYAHQTPPVMVSGIRPDAQTAVRAGLRFIQFASRPEEDAQAIDEYLKSLKPLSSPYLVNGKLSESAIRGKEIFSFTGCGRCHSGPLFTDMKRHDIGTGIGMEKDFRFDTPTLIEVWRTGPFLYDGRAASIKEIFSKYNNDDKHGHTNGLTEKQINDLTEYVLSL
ncbi:MAG: PQQ-binding-like beta-propeller repeat protein [Phycisphaerae bacterium]|nr:PQQ-binding-like beta-propeller repeat protein [Phycisphaerae bacterium]